MNGPFAGPLGPLDAMPPALASATYSSYAIGPQTPMNDPETDITRVAATNTRMPLSRYIQSK